MINNYLGLKCRNLDNVWSSLKKLFFILKVYKIQKGQFYLITIGLY